MDDYLDLQEEDSHEISGPLSAKADKATAKHALNKKSKAGVFDFCAPQ